MAFTIKVNGIDNSVDVDGDTPLLWVLRDVLGMTGTKFGCGMALCGACTVHMDGNPIRSCVTSIDSVGTSAITTIEAIGDTPAGRKIRRHGRQRWYVRVTTIEAIGDTPPAGRFRRHGSILKSFSAAIASPARSCPHLLSWRAIQIRTTPISTMRCPATFAAAAPTSASVKRSSRRRSPPQTDSEAEQCASIDLPLSPIVSPDHCPRAAYPAGPS